MTWQDFYLICFAIGFLLSFVSFFLGGLHLGDFSHGHSFDFGGHGDASGGTHAGDGSDQVSPINLFTIAAFLAWFGGTGYLLSRYSTIVFALALLLSAVVGLIGSAVVFLFLARVLTNPEANMDSADYEMVGVLGRTSLPIRQGGTGEIIYSQAGTRRTCGARSEDESAIEKGTEIVVTRYDKGIAYVRRWQEMSGE
jgi:membrane protein implicated in regulation of membrane protease activity